MLDLDVGTGNGFRQTLCGRWGYAVADDAFRSQGLSRFVTTEDPAMTSCIICTRVQP